MIPEIVALKACTHSPYSFWRGKHKDLFIVLKGQLKVPFHPDFSLAFAKDCGTGKAGRLFTRPSFPMSVALRVSSLRLFWCESRSAREGRYAKGTPWTLEENSKKENKKKRNFKIIYNSNWISCYLRSLVIIYDWLKSHHLCVQNGSLLIACERALRGALTARREKEGEIATTSLELEFHLQFPVATRRLSCQISARM